ncbi:MAG: penicillin-binding protein 2 [Chloroflexi bacterium]|nr:MAG: penicillin-binding protein 2 [Chloroflexota bacterium]TMG39916.1 MAG: penicillin-binding protein 2 [Chloroflexota bacterium]
MVRRAPRAFVHGRRFAAVGLAIVLVFGGLTARLYDLQIVRGDYYGALSQQNRILRLPVRAERGSVTDRNGRPLVVNIPGFEVSIIPVDLPRARESELALRLGALLGLPTEAVQGAITAQRQRNPYEPVRISPTPVPREIAVAVSERGELFPGVRVEPGSIRFYQDGELYAPVIGYTGPVTEGELDDLREKGYLLDDDIGRTGLEATYEKYLRGTYGWREVERDAAQREIKTLALRAPTVGNTVVLTIDDRLQKLLDGELRKGVLEDKFTQGVGIALNPQNGDILAMVSIPGYDNNAFARGISAKEIAALNADDRHPLVNKATSDIYPPGSTFKLVTGLSALSEGTANRDTTVNVSAMSFSVSGTPFYDWRAHGTLNFVTGFAHSSDIYFYTLAAGTPFAPSVRGVGPDAIAKYGRMLGFGAPTGIDIPNEASGIMPDPQWKQRTFDEPWSIGNTYHEAIGQGYVAVTPLQLLNAYASVANGGTLWRPHLFKEARDVSGTVVATATPTPIRKLDITAENLRLLRESARRVVTIGHAYMPNPKLPIAGKTGTAEFGASGGHDSAGRNIYGFHNWFVSFVPKADNTDPTAEIAMIIFVFNSSKSLCENCFNPAVGMSQRILEQYLLEKP